MQNAYVCGDETQGVLTNSPQALWGKPWWTEVFITPNLDSWINSFRILFSAHLGEVSSRSTDYSLCDKMHVGMIPGPYFILEKEENEGSPFWDLGATDTGKEENNVPSTI